MKTVGNLFTQMVNFLEQRLMTKMNKTKQCFTGSVETALWDKIPPTPNKKERKKQLKMSSYTAEKELFKIVKCSSENLQHQANPRPIITSNPQ